jgi:hypothetical protein
MAERLRWQVDSLENWRAIIKQMPAIEFPRGWKVKVIPPFAGAVARFLVCKGDREISVYLDWFSRLGCCTAPYWEAYPIGDDTERFDLQDTAGLVAAIRKELARK